MTPADLRAICVSLNDESGTGGQTKLVRLPGWDRTTVWQKRYGKSRITRADELAIRGAPDLDRAPKDRGYRAS
jgi:hypothetical protein